MKRFAQLAIISALSIPGATFAQSGDMKGMEMKNGCMDMKDMKGMDMKDMKNMNMQECKNMMKEHTADSKAQGAHKQGTVHKTSAVIKAVDPVNSKVTLDHDQVKTLNWPAMTMTFGVKEKSLLDKLAVGKKVDVEFTQQGSNYVVSAVK